MLPMESRHLDIDRFDVFKHVNAQLITIYLQIHCALGTLLWDGVSIEHSTVGLAFAIKHMSSAAPISRFKS